VSKPDNSQIGLCPKCGSVPSEEWVNGERGWICGSYFIQRRACVRAVYLPEDPLTQSIPCAVMHWRVRAEKAEAKLREIALDSPE